MTRRIFLDCDGVLKDFHSEYLALHNRLHGDSVTIDAWTSWEAEACFSTPELNAWTWAAIDATAGWCRDLPDSHGALWGLAALRGLKDAWVGCCTSPHTGPLWVPERYESLFELGFTKREIVLSSDKGHVQGDVLLDDHTKNCVEWKARNPHGLALLFDAPYNRGFTPRGVVRVYGWREAVGAIKLGARS